MGDQPSYTYIAITWMRELLLLQVPSSVCYLVGELQLGVIDLRMMMMVVVVVVVVGVVMIMMG